MEGYVLIKNRVDVYICKYLYHKNFIPFLRREMEVDQYRLFRL